MERMTVGAAALASGAVGVAVGAGAVLASRLGKGPQQPEKGAESTSSDKKSG